MSNIVEALLRGAEECRDQQVNGWGNTMSDAVTRIAELEAENARLRDALVRCIAGHKAGKYEAINAAIQDAMNELEDIAALKGDGNE